MSNIVYLLTNPVMPDLVKIGITRNLPERIRELSRPTSIPVPFVCHYACEVENAANAERKIHDAFGDHRINRRREFFRINPERVVSILKLIELKEVTLKDDVAEDQSESEALEHETSRRSKFKFSTVEIKPSSILTFARDENITAEVVNDHRIKFEGRETSLSAAAAKILKRLGGSGKGVAGPEYWMYEGKILSELRLEMEERESE